MKIEKINKTYDRHRSNANRVLKDVSFQLPQTGFVCILGPSGCGKTSLLNVIGGLDRFDSGILETDGVHVESYGTRAYEEERNSSFGYIFQNYYLLQEHTVAYNVYLGLHSLKLTHHQKLDRVWQALKEVDMERYLRRKVNTLSGGQQQRVAIARALARRPRVIFADEPTGNLDESNTMNICTLLRQISKTSLVVMVTHEERIARFFADRIITISDGQVAGDISQWDRDSLDVDTGNTYYAGDYQQEILQPEGLQLRLLRQEGAPPVELTVLALKDRILIKLADNRIVSCGTNDRDPIIKEGNRPVLTLEHLEREEPPKEQTQPNVTARAGSGLKLSMLYAEARALSRGKLLKRVATGFFVALLTVLTLLMVGDYLTLKEVDPHDFIYTDSHVLGINIERGSSGEALTTSLDTLADQFVAYCLENGPEMTLMPVISITPEIEVPFMTQLADQTIAMNRFSYVPLEYLSEESLIMGRMPENPTEVVVDRWVLDSILQEEGMAQNGIPDISYFLEKEIQFLKKSYTATIVGISDSGEAAMYMTRSAMLSVSVQGKAVLTLSEYQEQVPGFSDILERLEDGHCIYLVQYWGGESEKIESGSTLTVAGKKRYAVQMVEHFSVFDYASIVVNDDALDELIRATASTGVYLYCADKQAVKDFLQQGLPEELEGAIQVTVTDKYTSSMAWYQSRSEVKLDARLIVTVTVILLCMVMLYLLRRAHVQQRLELLAVYRLLGIPGRKLTLIFVIESCISFVQAALPAAILTWGVSTFLSNSEDVDFYAVLPFGVVAAVSGLILVYHILVSILPLWRLLRKPPAQLAAKYDI